jgi:LysR family transcriptional regulator, low CO2-responsive transcriptional regulator
MSILNLDVHQLIVFYYVATEESISIAAEKLCLTQPTLSYHLKSIEKYAGVKLFNIKKQRVYLTKAGQDLYPYTQEIWNQLNGIDKYLDSLKHKSIRAGVSPLVQNQAAAALSKVCKLHPEVNIEILNTVTVNIIQEVADRDIDVGIVMSTDYGNNKVKAIRISEGERLVFVVSPNFPLAKMEKVEWADLANISITCGQQGSLLNTLVTEKFRNAGILTPPHIMVNTLSNDVLKIFIKEGHGIGLWGIKEVEAEILSGELKVLKLPEEILVPIDFILNQNDELSQPVMKDFLKYIKRELSTPTVVRS